MTPTEHQMYSITESELEEFFNYIEDENNTEEKYKNARGLLARIRIRSRPVPSAPTDEQCRICSEAIRKDEREKVIKEIIGLQHVCNLAEYRASHRVILTADVEEILESLRSSSEARE